jgi:uncharacterized protein YjiS (DUF1127 family)
MSMNPKTGNRSGTLLCDIDPTPATAGVLFPRDRDPALISLVKILHCFRTGYRLARERYRQRKQLMEMDDRQLKDIGITPEQAEQEARKPIWKP